MSVTAKQVNVCSEVDALLGLVVSAVAEMKAGKKAMQIGTDLMPQFVSALEGLGDIGTEVKDRADLERTVALKLCDMVDVLAPVKS